MKAAFYTLGCKVNQNESNVLQAMFCEAGYEIVPMNETADVYVVNSCTVTAGGDAKSRQWLRRARRQTPGAITVLTGCFPQAFPEKAQIPEADVVTGTAERGKLLQAIESFRETKRQTVQIAPHSRGEAFEELPSEAQSERTRAFVKIQDGCNRRCAYCIIPMARGPVRSRAEGNILAELHSLAAKGYREVVFTGINLPSYGQDTGTDLADIAAKAAEVAGIERIRLSSLDPDLITPALVRRFAANKKLCPHFHLSLQSGCDDTLRRMRRPYTTAGYKDAARRLAEALPEAGFTTDVIVGFPGETDAEFAQSVAFVKEMQFLKVHVFPFSARPGTPAAEFEAQVPKAEKHRRAAQMQQAADDVRNHWLAGREGTRHMVLLESPLHDGHFTGYTESYIPVVIHAPGARQGDIVAAQLGALNGERCVATLL